MGTQRDGIERKRKQTKEFLAPIVKQLRRRIRIGSLECDKDYIESDLLGLAELYVEKFDYKIVIDDKALSLMASSYNRALRTGVYYASPPIQRKQKRNNLEDKIK